MQTRSFGITLISVVLVAMALLAACQRSENDALDIPPPPAAVQTITRVSDTATLESYLKAGIRARTSSYSVYLAGGEPAIMTTTASATSAPAMSGTNLQEAGVDEGDRVKSDGQWLYLLNHPADCCAATAPVLRVMQLASTPSASASERAQLPLGTAVGGDELYLFSASGGVALDRLAVVGNAHSVATDWYAPWSWQNGGVDLTIVDVTAPATPAIQTRLHIDGYLVSSRRIGDTLYIVSRYAATVPGYKVYPATDVEKNANEQLLQSAPLGALLPDWQVGGTDKGNLFTADSCYLLPVAQEDYSPDLVTLTAIDLRHPAATPKSTCLLGPSETLYASTEAIYLATTRYHYPQPGVLAPIAYPAEIATDLHKFALTAAGPELRGSTTVPGHLGWHQDKKPFRLGEYQGVLRVVTSSGFWGDEQVLLTTLAEQGGKLVELAHLPNAQRPATIGKPGEQLYAVRFVGNRGFAVTFRTTDPLYVLDLTDPLDPFIAGELQIAGYSDYLHPVSETRLLGIGKDAVPVAGDGDGRGAWYQGVKISLFDISNPAAPSEIDSKVIGQRGTEAGALYDHHAFAWLPADPATNRPARLALPIELHETVGVYPPTEPWDWYEWTHRGLYLFDIDPLAASGAITARGALVVADAASAPSAGEWVATDRAVIVNDDVHYVHGDKVWSAVWGTAGSLTPAQ